MTDNQTNTVLSFPYNVMGDEAYFMDDATFLHAGRLRAAHFLNGVAAGRNKMNEKVYYALKGMNEILSQYGYPLAVDPEELERLRP